MSTPAEIIAARVNGISNSNEEHEILNAESPIQVSSDSDDLNSFNESEASLTTSAPSISDDSAFPTLGGKKSSILSSTPSWGPAMKAPKSVSASPSAAKATSAVGTGKFKGSTIQEAFSLDSEDQLNVARPEFIKILTAVKADTKTNIECTTSQHTKKRTFLITGKPEEVKLAKRLVIKKLTKPVKITFNVPGKVRSKIIGPQGRTLKPIIQSNEVKIDIGHPEESQEAEAEDDIFAQTVRVTVEGDVEGCKHAKALILAIVKEETKTLSTRLAIEDIVKPFAGKVIDPIVQRYSDLDISVPDYKSSNSNIHIVGDRESVIEAKEQIKDALDALSGKILVEEVPIPKTKHQFLPIDSILEENNVLIKLPGHDETNVKFIGEKKNIPAAQENARKTTSQYKVEVLDMSKAHKGNMNHVKAVASLLVKNGTFKSISEANDVVINAPSKKQLEDKEATTIPIEIVLKNDDTEKAKVTRKAIVSVVNKISPDSTKVINDVAEFLIRKVPSTIDEIAAQNNVSYVILGNTITLFSKVEDESDDFDFVDSSNSSDSFAPIDKSLNKLRELSSDLHSVVLKVPFNQQTEISGPRDTTLKAILSGVEANSVVVKLHSNASGKSADEIYIHGIKSAVSTVQNDIEATLKDAETYKEQGGFKTSFEVPSSVLSRLIGKNGSNMISLREQFGVKIDVSDDGKQEGTKDKNDKTEIVISGNKRNAEDCKASIAQFSKKWADETLARLRIESQYHRRMIGPSGVYINRLQDKYDVKIRFPSVDNVPSTFADAPKSKDEVTIKGPSKGVAKAEEELKELYQFEKENGFKETMQVPTKAIARVIGKSGETINDIADGCGIEYKFNRDNDNESEVGYTEVELTGSRSALKEATKKIQEIIDEAENFTTVTINVDSKYHRELIGQGGSVMKEIIANAGGEDVSRAKYFRLLSIPNEGSGSDEVTSQGDKTIVNKVIEQVKKIIAAKEASVIVEYDLPKEKHRLIVGQAGSIRHALQDEFKAQIDIPRPSDESTTIKLVGLPEQIEGLKAKIESLTKDDWNVSIDIPENYHALVSERGAIFKKLQADYNVQVQHGNLTRKASKLSSAPIPTPSESAYPSEDEKAKFTVVPNDQVSGGSDVIPWRLKGDEKDTKKAATLIQERLENAKNATSIGWFYSLNPSSFYKVVGSQGSKINDIRKKSSTFITVPRANDKNANFIYLVGSESNLDIAKEAIEALLK